SSEPAIAPASAVVISNCPVAAPSANFESSVNKRSNWHAVRVPRRGRWETRALREALPGSGIEFAQAQSHDGTLAQSLVESPLGGLRRKEHALENRTSVAIVRKCSAQTLWRN